MERRVSGTSWKWYWMPASVFLIGMFSILLFFGFVRIKDHQIIYSTLIDAVLDIQIKTATFHLRLEEEQLAVARPAVPERAVTDIDQAIRLSDTVINTVTVAGQGLIPGPAKLTGVRTRAEEIKSLLKSLKHRGVELRQRFGDARIDQEFDMAYAEVLGKTALLGDIVKSARAENRRKMEALFLGIVSAWTLAVFTATAGLCWMEMRRKKAEESLLDANNQLLLQAEELTAHRENLAVLVEKRTSELSAANRQVRELSSQLLRAQEIERRRLSMELHDGLGQALNVTKLRIRLIEDGLVAEQGATRESCESLLEYLDEVIEEVRRLSLDLSPAVLEDLGLTSALRWLVSDFKRIHTMEVSAEIDEIDDLFPENHLITVYRVMQEALTNAGKHSRAQNVSVAIRRHDDRVSFVVADDGTGFDLNGCLKRGDSKMSLGLTTMNERVWMMGGVFELWSRAGEGTRITFSVPVGTGCSDAVR